MPSLTKSPIEYLIPIQKILVLLLHSVLMTKTSFTVLIGLFFSVSGLFFVGPPFTFV